MHHPITATVALALALAGISLPEAMASVSRVPGRIVYVSGSGFDWGDAGIGAAARSRPRTTAALTALRIADDPPTGP